MSAPVNGPFWRAMDAIFGAAVRDYYAKKYGKCRACERPLGGESPEQVCVECHAGEVLADGLSGGVTIGGDA